MPWRLLRRAGCGPLFSTALIALATGTTATLTSDVGGAAQVPAGTQALPAIRHVFVIVLENESSSATFDDPRNDPYLARTLPVEGAYLPNYYAIGHESNENYVAMISGQAPNPQNQADCQIYDDFVGVGPLPIGSGTPLSGQAAGTGCIYPASVPTIANQLSAAGYSWKGYMEDMGNDPGRESASCGHPTVGDQDGTQLAVPGDGYVTRHDPSCTSRASSVTPLTAGPTWFRSERRAGT